MTLSVEERDKLPAEDFALPEKRELPIHDETHTRLAWTQVDHTHGLSDEEKAEARRRIMERAHKLGIDTTEWSARLSGAIDLQAMSLEVPNTPGHPNKRPFKGILTRIDEPSDGPPNGSGGRRVFLTKAAAEAALPTLLGMAVDCSKNLSDHAESHKIGIITGAEISGNAIEIEGYFYAKDFPAEMRAIDKNKSKLGFSFELSPTKWCVSPENYFRVEAGIFTGAALLYKDKAAYQTTALTAGADTKENEMELKDLVEAVGKLTAAVEAQGAGLAALQTKVDATQATVNASKECMAKVEPHAEACDACAASMEKDAVGSHPKYGHVKALRSMAASLRAGAAMGQIPHIWRDHDYPLSANTSVTEEPKTDPAVTKAIDELKASQKATADALAAISTGIADLRATKREGTEAPTRKTVTPEITALLARHGINAQADKDGGFDIDALSAEMVKAGIAPEVRMQLKRSVERAAMGLRG